ncbi:MAG: M56 family metallopeptidase [Planctomycetes bacterium]|nr:M56 family metallopeptidase [Planctomycetota bacterium]
MIALSLVALEVWLEPVATWLGTFAIHSTVALALTLTITRVLGRRHLSLQDTLLRQVLWLPLVSASLQVAFVGSLWTVLFAPPELTAADLATLARMVDEAPVAAAAAPVVEVATPLPWATIAVAVALGAALGGSFWLWRTWRRLGRILAERRPETDPRVLSAAARLASSLGLRQSPHISRAAQLSTPIAFGFVSPEICLPERAARLDEASLQAMLGHELAHLRRRDPAWMWIAAVVHAVMPWQLLLLGVRRQWSRVVELRCDAEAAHHTSPTAVARCLIEVAEWLRPQRAPMAVSLGMAARPSALRERVEAALGATEPRSLRRVGAGALAALSLAALTTAAPGVPGVRAGRSHSAEDFAAAFFAPEPSVALRLQPYVELVETEYAAVVREAQQLELLLQLRPDPTTTLLQERLQRRLDVLARLRARLMARLGRAPSLNR